MTLEESSSPLETVQKLSSNLPAEPNPPCLTLHPCTLPRQTGVPSVSGGHAQPLSRYRSDSPAAAACRASRLKAELPLLMFFLARPCLSVALPQPFPVARASAFLLSFCYHAPHGPYSGRPASPDPRGPRADHRRPACGDPAQAPLCLARPGDCSHRSASGPACWSPASPCTMHRSVPKPGLHSSLRPSRRPTPAPSAQQS